MMRRFDKYDRYGAYHWREMDRTSRHFDPPLEARYQIVVKRLGTPGRVLDIGCGDGYLMNLASGGSGLVVGAEPETSGARLAAARLADLANCRVVQSSVYTLPFQPSAFDVVLMADVIEHLDDVGSALREVTRVVATDGCLLLTTPKWQSDRPVAAEHVKEYRPEELLTCLQAHFHQVRLTFFWPLSWSTAYRTRAGWKLIKLFAKCFYNPFLEEGCQPGRFCQILAECRHARRCG